ncbi:uncharacterized phage protein (predicted DNA packaging) [Ureibacillus xyleni]|uniref:Uncharacterized phage protein (Predicted DNA packaging) n=2 Tax=Ureibacillus xyleni TaxID=614648 RepID=A0A285SW25_9BACL|nr:uncharacterized phage protein (predicted DNA packaging) [Ureibacillus xyleni]
MLQKVKKALRISNNAFDDEIQDLIDGALADLFLSGVINFTNDDPLILRAVITYCKSHFGLENADSEKYGRSYDSLKNHLSLAGDYSDDV